jgi:hypothetical protein
VTPDEKLARIAVIIGEWWKGFLPMNVALSEIRQIVEAEDS